MNPTLQHCYEISNCENIDVFLDLIFDLPLQFNLHNCIQDQTFYVCNRYIVNFKDDNHTDTDNEIVYVLLYLFEVD